MPQVINQNDEALVQTYSDLFHRFIDYIHRRGYADCFMSNEENQFIAEFQMIAHDKNFVEELRSWPEWIQLNDLVQRLSGEELNYYFVIGHQFTAIYNSVVPLRSQFSPVIARVMPRLSSAINNPRLLTQTLLSGEMTSSQPVGNDYVALIKGLKIAEQLDIGDYGYFAPVDFKNFSTNITWFHPARKKYLYSAFYFQNENLVSDDFVTRLLAALRCWGHGDVKFVDLLRSYEDLTRTFYYQYPIQSPVTYVEHSALFNEIAPTLLEVDGDQRGAFSDFINSFLSGTEHMSHSCHYLNKALLSDSSLELPMLFFAGESCFSFGELNKGEMLSKFMTNILNESDDFEEMVQAYYQARNYLVHGDRKEFERRIRKIGRDHPISAQYPKGFRSVMIALFVELANRGWKPKGDGRRLRKAFEAHEGD